MQWRFLKWLLLILFLLLALSLLCRYLSGNQIYYPIIPHSLGPGLKLTPEVPLPSSLIQEEVQCSQSGFIGEETARKVMNDLFPFYSFCRDRTQLYSNERGTYLELDGYNPEIRVAFEYQGIQHYKWPNSYHHTRQEFEDQLRRDQIKRQLCGEEIFLVYIDGPEIDKMIKRNQYKYTDNPRYAAIYDYLSAQISWEDRYRLISSDSNPDRAQRSLRALCQEVNFQHTWCYFD